MEEFRNFVTIVEEMREAQKNYFQTRDPNVLSEAKLLEKKVDRHIHHIKSQTSLFKEEDGK